MNAELREIIDLLCDADALSDLTRMDVVATRLRIKPGVSIAVALAERETGGARAWARILWPKAHCKAGKAQRRADERGLRTTTIAWADLLIQVGEILSDPDLIRPLDSAYEQGLIVPDAPMRVLRHNPLRRLVLADASRVVRVSADPQAPGPWVEAFAARACPAPTRLDDGSEPTVSARVLVGDHDLADVRDPRLIRRVGSLIARLHGAPTRFLPPRIRGRLLRRAPRPDLGLDAHARLLDAIDPHLAVRIRRTHLDPDVLGGHRGAPVLSHGDATTDQVLIDEASGSLWLTDFDRICLAPRSVDLGSLAAQIGPGLVAPLLEGYEDEGGRAPSEGEIVASTGGALALRVLDPLRAARPNWREEAIAVLDRLERTC